MLKTLIKGVETMQVGDEHLLSAFLNNGWEIKPDVKEAPKKEEKETVKRTVKK